MRALIAVLAAAILLGLGAGTASASSLCSDCTASYSGKWTVSDPSGAMVTLFFDEGLQSGVWSLASATGSYSEPANPDNHYPGCSATLSRNAAVAANLGTFGPNVIVRKTGYWTTELFPPTYWGLANDPVNSSESTGECASSARVDYSGLSRGLSGSQCHLDPTAGNVEAIDFPIGSSYTVADNCSGTLLSNGVDYTASLQSSITFSSPGVVSPGGTGPGGNLRLPYGPWFPKAKSDARSDLRAHAIPNAIDYCLPFTTGALLTGAGVLISATPGGAGLILTVSGGLTASAAAPFCGATVKRLIVDYKAYNDPPSNDFGVIARPKTTHTASLPSCARFPGAAGRLCRSLGAAENRWVTAAQNSESVAVSLEQTVSREHAAAIAGNQTSLNAQDAALKTLIAERRGTTAAEGAAGKALASLLRGARLKFRVTKAQATTVVTLVKRRITSGGVPAVDVIGLDEAGFQPRARDLLAALGSL